MRYWKVGSDPFLKAIHLKKMILLEIFCVCEKLVQKAASREAMMFMGEVKEYSFNRRETRRDNCLVSHTRASSSSTSLPQY